MLRRFLPLLLCFVPAPALAAESADNWPQFRGPGGQGHAAASGLPIKWSESENVDWRVEIKGRGWSSPVVYGDQIWLTTAIEQSATPEDREKKLAGDPFAKNLAVAAHVSLKAVCLHRTSGKQLHEIALFTVDQPDPIHTLNSFASPTPVIEAGRVFCHFGTYGTACIDTASGSVLWKASLPVKHSVGPGSSPVLVGDLLILTCDGTDAQYVAAMHKNTGELVWKKNRPPMEGDDGDHHKAFATPLLVEAFGRSELVIPGAQWIVSYQPKTGEEHWRLNHGKGFSNVPRPVFGGETVYICTGYMTHELWAVKLAEDGKVNDKSVAWRARKQIPDRPSPLLIGEELYVVSGAGVATCFDTKTGEPIWRERMSGNYSASPVYADGRIYFCSHEGKTTVVQPGRKYRELAASQLEGRIMASPAMVDGAIFLRTDSHLYRLATSAKTSTRTGGAR